MEQEPIQTKKPLKMFLSLLSGEIYEVEEDEVKNLDRFQIPLLHRPKSSCKKCYGRGYIGHSPANKTVVLCASCMRKCIDHKAIETRFSEEMKRKYVGLGVEENNATQHTNTLSAG